MWGEGVTFVKCWGNLPITEVAPKTEVHSALKSNFVSSNLMMLDSQIVPWRHYVGPFQNFYHPSFAQSPSFVRCCFFRGVGQTKMSPLFRPITPVLPRNLKLHQQDFPVSAIQRAPRQSYFLGPARQAVCWLGCAARQTWNLELRLANSQSSTTSCEFSFPKALDALRVFPILQMKPDHIISATWKFSLHSTGLALRHLHTWQFVLQIVYTCSFCPFLGWQKRQASNFPATLSCHLKTGLLH